MVKGEFPGGLTIKDSVLTLLWLRFDPWQLPHAEGAAKKKKKRKERNG